MTSPIIITRRPAKWNGPLPEPEDFDGYRYNVAFVGHRFGGYGLEWIRKRVIANAPTGVVVITEWGQRLKTK